MLHQSFLKYSSITLVLIGCVLLVGPESWFPDFYSPIFMGVVAITSPILIYLPRFILTRTTPRKRKLILEMRSVIAFALLVNFAGELGLFQLYRYGFEYDKFAHFIVPMAFAYILGRSLREWEDLHAWRLIGSVLLIVVVSGAVWEFFEATSDYLFQTQVWGVYGQHLVADTYMDMLFNTLGAIVGIILFKIPRGRRTEATVNNAPPKIAV